MRIGSIVRDIDTWEVLDEQTYEWTGPVALCKGGESKQAAKDAAAQRELDNRIMQEQLAMQRDQLAKVSGGVSQFLTPEGQGFDEKTMAALNANAIEGIPGQFEDARKQMMMALAARGGAGGQLPVGGDFLRNLASFNAARETAKAGALRDVQIKNALANLQNRFTASNALLGVGSQYNPSPFISGASSALSSQTEAAKSADQAGTAVWGALIGAGGNLLGNAISPGGIFRPGTPAPSR